LKDSFQLESLDLLVRDARGFAPETIQRKTDPESLDQSVMLLVEKKCKHNCDNLLNELVITILFDKLNNDHLIEKK